MSKIEITPMRLSIEQFATLATCSTSKLWDLTNCHSDHFDSSAPPRIKFGGNTRFDRQRCVEWLKAMESPQK